jgi:hypothetical protein
MKEATTINLKTILGELPPKPASSPVCAARLGGKRT